MPVITFDEDGITGGGQLLLEFRIGELGLKDVLHNVIADLIPISRQSRFLLAGSLGDNRILDLGVLDLRLLGGALLGLECSL